MGVSPRKKVTWTHTCSTLQFSFIWYVLTGYIYLILSLESSPTLCRFFNVNSNYRSKYMRTWVNNLCHQIKDCFDLQVDFPEVARQKTNLILQNRELSQALGTITSKNEQWLGGGKVLFSSSLLALLRLALTRLSSVLSSHFTPPCLASPFYALLYPS